MGMVMNKTIENGRYISGRDNWRILDMVVVLDFDSEQISDERAIAEYIDTLETILANKHELYVKDKR